MDYIAAADGTLGRAENELRELLVDAGKAGAYDLAAALSGAARTIATLRQHLASPISPSMPTAANDLPDPAVPSANTHLLFDNSPRRSTSAPRSLVRTQFGRDERCLIKIAWSKSKGADYAHKAPVDVARVLVKTILRHGGAKRLVTTEKFLPLISSDKSEIPSYQSYLCLAWLVHEGLIGKNGRRGYTVFDAQAIEKSIEECWEKLPRI